MEAHAFGTALMHPHTLSTYPKAPRIGTIPGPTWDPRGARRVPHPIQVGPMYYSDGPTVLLSEFFYLKKIIFLPLFDNSKYI